MVTQPTKSPLIGHAGAITTIGFPQMEKEAGPREIDNQAADDNTPRSGTCPAGVRDARGHSGDQQPSLPRMGGQSQPFRPHCQGLDLQAAQRSSSGAAPGDQHRSHHQRWPAAVTAGFEGAIVSGI
jgi:hypothetical protein